MDLSRIADPEKRRRLENILRHLLGLVYIDYWGTVSIDLKGGLVVSIREERTLDPGAPTTTATE